MTTMLDAALEYAELLGWPVFPCRPRGKAPLTEHGHLDATIDISRLRDWWRRVPEANVAIACDQRSGLLVVDVDPRHGGDERLAELEAVHGVLPHTPTGLTGGGGLHYVFRRPAGMRYRDELAPGIDIKASGYIVAPPSIHPDTGRRYLWDAGAHPLETPLAELPAWVLERIRAPQAQDYGQPADDAATSFLARAFAAAGWLGRRIDAQRIAARCPWESMHTTRSGDSSTVIFAPRARSVLGWFHCAHTSHGRKTLADVLAALPLDAVKAASADCAIDRAADALAALDDETAERVLREVAR